MTTSKMTFTILCFVVTNTARADDGHQIAAAAWH